MGISNLDIMPDNIMYDVHGSAMSTDFRNAKATAGGKPTGTGMSIGTPHYMSPEQARAQPLDGRSDLCSLGVVAYQCLTGGVPFDGEDSFAIGYKHIMEELPTPSLETPDKRSLFEIIRKMVAKLPDDRFQDADDLVQALEGGAFAPLAIATAPTRAIPSLSKLTAAPTTPLPKPGRPGAPGEHHRSVAAAVSIWLFIVLSLAGGGGFYAYKKGWLLATPGPATGARDSTARDTSAAADSAGRADTSGALASAAGGGTGHDTSRSHQPPPPPGTPARLTLQGVPQGARVTLNGQPVRGPQVDVPPGVYKLAVRAGGYQPYERQVVVPPGAPLTVRVELQPSAFIAPGAVVLGDVTLGARVSVWYGAVLRGDTAPISVGEASNVQDGSIIHVDEGLPATIGARVGIGHRAVLHGCTVEDECLIGMGSILLNDVRIGTGSVVAAGAVVPEGPVVPRCHPQGDAGSDPERHHRARAALPGQRRPRGPGRRARGPVLAGRPHRRRARRPVRGVGRSGRDRGRGLLRADGDPRVDAELTHAHERRPPARPAVGLLRAAGG